MSILFLLKPKATLSCLYGDYTVRQALEKMYDRRYTVFPIIGTDGTYVGTLSEGDILYYLKEHEYVNLHQMEDLPIYEISRYRSYQPIKVDAEMKDLYPMVEAQNFVPVVDDRNVFIGIITRKGVLKHLVSNQK